MPVLHPTRLVRASRAPLQILAAPRSHARRQQPLSSTAAPRAEHAEGHEDQYDPPGGWLWGVKPGEKYQKQGWEGVFIYGFFGSLLFGLVGYCYKPDTKYVNLSPALDARALWTVGGLER